MPELVVQMGHCYRKTGATGTIGEQNYAERVAAACMRLLHNKSGWVVNTTLADENDYEGNAFVAVHCDGSDNSSARGASVGYRTPEGQAFGQAWKRAYAARGWPIFRADNYTSALSGYYGTRNAVAAGNRRAIIIECGFRTNTLDRALLDGPGGVDRVALSIGDALGISTEDNSSMTTTPAQVWGYENTNVDPRDAFGMLKAACDDANYAVRISTENQRRIGLARDEIRTLADRLGAVEKRVNDVYAGVSQILAKLDEGSTTP